MAATPVAEMESLLTCSICLETLTDPRTLGCFHSFCKCCLEKYVKRQRDEASAKPTQEDVKKDVEEFNCPVCRSVFSLKQGQGVEAVSASHFVSNMLEVLAIQRRAKDIPCSLCEGISVCRCTTCNRFLCEKCLSVHENWLEFKNHVVLTMDELAVPENHAKTRGKAYCKKHEKKTLKFYCETCEEMICRYCMDFKHAKENHSCLLAEDIAEKEREAIKQCSNSLEENLKEANKALQEISNVTQSLGKHAENAKEDITRHKEEIVKTFAQKLEEKAKLMISDVDEVYKKTCEPLAKQKSEIEQYVKKLRGSVDLSKNLLDKGNIGEILSSKKMIQENAEKVKNECPKRMEPVHDGVLEFKIKNLDYSSVLDNLGELVYKPVKNLHTIWTTSEILKDNLEYSLQLEEWMNSEFQWHLCYRASTDGWRGRDFHRCCDDKGPTLTVVEVGEYIFGGYTDQSWAGAEEKHSTSSFMFSLRNKDNLPPFKADAYRNEDSAIHCNAQHGPIFGSGRDLKIYNNAHTSKQSFTRFGGTYELPMGYAYNNEQTNSLLSGSFRFTPTEIEVFY